jgi:Acetyltransferase (GNAT) domain
MTKTASDYAVRTVTNIEEIERLRAFWSPLNRHPDADIDFFSFFVRTQRADEMPFVLILTENEEPKALLIGRLENTVLFLKIGYVKLFKLRLRQLTFLADGAAGCLGESTPEVARIFTEKILELLKSKTADRAVLSTVRTDSELYNVARTAPGRLQRDYAHETTPHWAMSIPATFGEFLKQVSSKRRWWLRHLLREIEKDHNGQVICKTFHNSADVESFCADAEKVAKLTYQRGLGVGFMNTEHDRQRLELSAEKGWLRAYILYAEDKPIAFWYGVVYKRVWYSFWTGYDPAYQSYNPGTVLLLKMLEDLCASNVSEIDFGIGPAEYKERFGHHNRIEAFVNIHAPTLKGVAASLLTLVNAFISRSGKTMLRKLKVVSRMKRYWRKKLAPAATKEELAGQK